MLKFFQDDMNKCFFFQIPKIIQKNVSSTKSQAEFEDMLTVPERLSTYWSRIECLEVANITFKNVPC